MIEICSKSHFHFYFDVQVVEHVQGDIRYLHESKKKFKRSSLVCKTLLRIGHSQFFYIYVSGENQIKAGQLNVIQALLEMMLVHKAHAGVLENVAEALHLICETVGFNNNKCSVLLMLFMLLNVCLFS